MKYNFNSTWKINKGDTTGAEVPSFDDTSWKPVTLPYAWNEDSAFKVTIDDLPTGIAWYRKHFKVPAADKGKKVFLEFEGIRMAGEFYLNGKFIGRQENGISAFGFDISDLLLPGDKENVLAVRIDNAWNYKEKATGSGFQWNDKNFNANYGGIQRNVWLHVTDKLYQTLPLYQGLQTTGTYIYAADFDIPAKKARITAESQVKNEDKVTRNFRFEVQINDISGKMVKLIKGPELAVPPGQSRQVSASAMVEGLNFWSWGYGYLYTVNTRLVTGSTLIDEVITKTGFRKTAFKNGMVYLNDRVIMMHGYAQRTSNEWPAIGASVPAWLSDYSNNLMVESGGNLVRWMHITPWKQDIESCDRVGLIQAMPAGDSEADVTGRRWEQRKEVMRDGMIYNRNNPSIIFYESGNAPISLLHMSEMKAIRNEFDPHGGRAIGSRSMLADTVAEYGGEMLYTNKGDQKPFWAMEYSRDEGLRKYWDNFTPPFHIDGTGPLHKGASATSYNRNQDTHALENVARWYEFWREGPGTGNRVSAGGVNIIFSDSNTHHRGEENYRRSGEVDAMRIAKDGFHTHQVMWNGWVEPDLTGIHIIGHWNYKAGVKKDVYVIAAGQKVELFVNGKSKGYGIQNDRFAYTFHDVQWQAGTIRAVSYSAEGKKLAETQVKTAGPAVALRLSPILHPSGLKADGADLALVQVEVIDAAGNRCPTALDMVNFTLTGPAEWRGGIAQGPDNYILAKSLPVECGVNRVLLRSATKAGKIVLTASATGLKAGTLTLSSIPVSVKDGLSPTFPADGLTPGLLRGPTPAGVSYTTTRKSLKITGATAGANADKAAESYDDKETTGWANDGKLSNAWIRYTLDTSSVINELTLKMNGFKNRRNLKIMVDNTTVFNGTTAGTLGYCTLAFKPVTGKTVTIQLMPGDAGKEEDKVGVEVSGTKLADGIQKENTRGTFSIIEADIYQRTSKN